MVSRKAEGETLLISKTENNKIDEVLYLQHYSEGWGTEFVRKFDERPCTQTPHYKNSNDGWRGWFYSYDDVLAKNFKCVSIQGDSETLKQLILHSNHSQKSSIFIDRAETILHENYGDVEYWRARRSMRYSNQLVEAANVFRKKHFNSEDVKDKTMLAEDWRNEKARRSAVGGDYVGIHWRRRDFLYARKAELSSVKGTAKILETVCEKLELKRIYLATDAPEEEIEELKSFLKDGLEVFRFTDTQTFNDGQIAIIDQLSRFVENLAI
uniref:GDP-fucose protein O-fucosyltransferase 2 n=1 Tax=Caenorhabditis japonica TaxID=281687 RepID=A0A8R1E4R8_CAEJA